MKVEGSVMSRVIGERIVIVRKNLHCMSLKDNFYCKNNSVYSCVLLVYFVETFLGGLSLHLNHLIASRTGISFRQFGTLSIGIFLLNLDSRHLITSPRTILGQF